jgi:flagellar biosynthesis/type III secretory pathway M-ring protein FliF/YscJ
MTKTANVPLQRPRASLFGRMAAVALACLVGSAVADETSTALAERLRLESAYRERLVDLLEAVVGRGNVRVEVSAVVDLSRTEQTSEQFAPADSRQPAVRSRSTSTVDRPAPPVLDVAPFPSYSGSSPPQTAPKRESLVVQRQSDIHYELDKTTRRVWSEPDGVRRLRITVLVNDASSAAGSGEQIARLEALVRDAIPIEPARGDTLRVLAMPFKVDRPREGAWLSRALVLALVVAAVAALAFGARLALARRRSRRAAALQAEEPVKPSWREEADAVRELVRGDPRIAAQVVRQWIRSDG